MARALQALPREDERTQMRWRKQSHRERSKFNSGRTGEGIDLPPRCRIVLPADAQQQRAAALATTSAAPLSTAAYPILWESLASIVRRDEGAFKASQASRALPWLSVAKHMVLVGACNAMRHTVRVLY